MEVLQHVDAQRLGTALVFTLMFGPLGLAIYLLTRKLSGKGGWSLDEQPV